MKALAFSLDALFALLITASGVTVMLYFVYNTITPSAIQYSSSSNFVAQLASEKLSSLVGVPIALTMSNQSMASGQSWPERLADSFNSGGNQYGPSVY
ncbi:MAG: hypothetical protein KGH64_06210, partial [Candidatus Micrarchaeota archaeon]|nr:hypothetical protein [Candidatus Micrarchaeota archaeon]